MISKDSCDESTCPWSEREAELLAITLELLQQHGYDRFSVEAVATTAKASKATVYRRWPTKADLVLAAIVEGIRSAATPPNTGSLRGDLLSIGRATCEQALEHMRTMRAVLNEMSHSPALREAMQQKFVLQHTLVIDAVLAAAVERGEIEASAINHEIYDLLPGYLVFRALVADRPPTEETVRVVVDDVLLPSLNAKG
ncbi:TetR family transcriptional regulator [Mycolicibacter arupensis]|uniref:TetR family transcriptional regulator n=2 Tax=Mycolicibacter arupensis TaxID=342002 RepID=A0A0F5MZ38_9MYCO|nr:TetR/AcrR family transcriptional regulator [Mycolicibacter arupensis]KKB99966.1 TetR family transcriptional regulator [Mycolicibacter arupensis]MCV7276650.1 TetR/AcrR family transcriptional regulator [Mycolicibacter arupensis]OQZ95557.1 TetR family transcriptional regulator [Mycolicibacter arupensis]TXI59394.1 MAG: TetR/AcrR family transcriptional regulator [Mycolicibacter arupensis]